MTTKSKNGKPATSRKSVRGLLPGRGKSSASSGRSATSGSRGLLGRAQATVPGVRRNTKKSGLQKIVAALGKANRPTAHKASTKRALGILTGAVGAAAVARRRHDPDKADMPTTPGQPVTALDATPPPIVETAIERTSTTGEHYGVPQEPDPETAA